MLVAVLLLSQPGTMLLRLLPQQSLLQSRYSCTISKLPSLPAGQHCVVDCTVHAPTVVMNWLLLPTRSHHTVVGSRAGLQYNMVRAATLVACTPGPTT